MAITKKVNWRGIVKVQRQLNAPYTGVMIYSQDRTVMWQDELTADLLPFFGRGATLHPKTQGELGERFKFYAYAELRGTIIQIVRRVADRDW